MKLPKGEETLPIIEIEGKMMTLQEVRQFYPSTYQRLVTPRLRLAYKVSDELLVERFRIRLAQGRVATIYRWGVPMVLTPEQQLIHMEARDEIGLELIEAERKLLGEELAMLKR